jgi:hypothetical protein
MIEFPPQRSCCCQELVHHQWDPHSFDSSGDCAGALTRDCAVGVVTGDSVVGGLVGVGDGVTSWPINSYNKKERTVNWIESKIAASAPELFTSLWKHISSSMQQFHCSKCALARLSTITWVVSVRGRSCREIFITSWVVHSWVDDLGGPLLLKEW